MMFGRRPKSQPIDVDELAATLGPWASARGTEIDGVLKAAAGEFGGPAEVATSIASAVQLGFAVGPEDVLGFANVAVDGSDGPLMDLPLSATGVDGTEVHSTLGQVVARIRQQQPAMFDLLVDLQRTRNGQLQQASAEYVALARTRTSDAKLILAANEIVGRAMPEHTCGAYVVSGAASLV